MMLACEIATVGVAAVAEERRVELQPDEEHVEDDADLGDDAEERRHRRGQAGSADAWGAKRPSSDGPSRMPAMISPMTGGWWKRLKSVPSARATTMTTASASEDVEERVGGAGLRGRAEARSARVGRAQRQPGRPDDEVEPDRRGEHRRVAEQGASPRRGLWRLRHPRSILRAPGRFKVGGDRERGHVEAQPMW